MTLELKPLYEAYIACLNTRSWADLGDHVHDEVEYNGTFLSLDTYRAMLVENVEAIPDLYFDVTHVIVEAHMLASRLLFNCTPKGELFGFAVNGTRVSFSENVFYEFDGSRIAKVWSVIDKSAVAQQVQPTPRA